MHVIYLLQCLRSTLDKQMHHWQITESHTVSQSVWLSLEQGMYKGCIVNQVKGGGSSGWRMFTAAVKKVR